MKRLLGLILSAALVFSTGVPTYAAESESKQLESVLKSVKQVIEVADDASFSYDSYQTENGNDKNRIWYLRWDKEKQNVSVEVMSDGTIMSYSRYEDNQNKGLSSLSREEGGKISLDFIKAVLPSQIKIEEVKLEDTWINDTTMSYNYGIYKGGNAQSLQVKNVSLRVTVDKYDKKVTGYYCDYLIQYLNTSFPSDSGMIGEEKAANAYMDADGVKLVYIPVPDYDKKKTKVFAAYVQGADNFYIDAKTGEPVYAPQYYSGRYDKAGAGGMGGISNEERDLSPAEQAEVDRLKEFISSEEAAKIIKEKAPIASKMGKVTGTSFRADYFNEKEYYWNISFEEGNATVDAKSGEIRNLDYYGERSESKRGISYEKAASIAQDFVNKATPSRAEAVKIQENSENSSEDSFWTVEFQRYEKDTEVYGNNLTVYISKANGTIYSYYTYWNNIESFPQIQDNLGKAGAFKVYDENKTFSPMYVMKNTGVSIYDTIKDKKDNVALLVYGFTERKSFAVDSTTGDLLTMNGKAYKGEGGNSVSYSDIKGKWYEATVSKLLENGYYIEGEKFEAAKQITQEEFFRYLYSPIQFYYETEELYDMLKYSDVIKEAEIAPSKILTRQEAAKFSIRYLGLDKAATIKGIYKKPFNDRIAESYEGYAAISKGLGIMKGDSKGRFNGANVLNRAESAVIIFNTVNIK